MNTATSPAGHNVDLQLYLEQLLEYDCPQCAALDDLDAVNRAPDTRYGFTTAQQYRIDAALLVLEDVESYEGKLAADPDGTITRRHRCGAAVELSPFAAGRLKHFRDRRGRVVANG